MNDSKCIKFSIIIPVYDRKDYVRKAVNSCLIQEYSRDNIEIIVVKNFLDDHLEEWLRGQSVLYINSDKVNLVDKLIEGINISNNDVICLLEDDDEFVIDKLKILNKYYKKFSDIACLHNNFRYMEEKGYKIDNFYLKHMKKLERVILLQDDDEKFSLIKNKDIYHNLSSWSFRRDYGYKLLKDLAGLTYDIDFLIYVQVIENRWRLLLLPDKLTIYRRHGSTTRIAVEDEKIINLFEYSIFSLRTIEYKLTNKKLRHFIMSSIDIEQFKINIIEEKFPKITDINKSIKILIYPPFMNNELYPFLFLYLILGVFKRFRKHLYVNKAYILN